MNNFNVYYDDVEDILYLGKEGKESEVVELSPGVNIELDNDEKMIGIELFKASALLKDVIKSIEKKVQAA